jgi:hypothetical protein
MYFFQFASNLVSMSIKFFFSEYMSFRDYFLPNSDLAESTRNSVTILCVNRCLHGTVSSDYLLQNFLRHFLHEGRCTEVKVKKVKSSLCLTS